MNVEYENTGESARPTNVLIERNTFTNTKVTNAKVIYLHGDSTCRFQNNKINAIVTGSQYANPIIQVENGGQIKIYNNTIVVQSDANVNLAIDVLEGCGADIRNNIIYHLGSGDNGKIGLETGYTTSVLSNNQYYSTGTPWWKYNGTDMYVLATWQSNSGDSNDGITDPKLVDAANGNFHLQASSPCENAGLSTLGVIYDKDGVSRADGNDIGAYQYI
jgi:hypothetical protein